MGKKRSKKKKISNNQVLLRRIFARLLDDFLVLVVVFPLVKINQISKQIPMVLISAVIVVGVGILYETVMLSLKGQTLGKMIMNIRVEHASSGSLKIRDSFFRVAMIRIPRNTLAAIYSISGIIVLLYSIVTISSGNTLYWDKFAKTECHCGEIGTKNIRMYIGCVLLLFFVFVIIGAYTPIFYNVITN